MRGDLALVAGVCAALIAVTGAWLTAWRLTDGAWPVLVLLWAMIAAASFTVSVALRRERLAAILLPGSPLSRWLRGLVIPALGAAGFATLSVLVILRLATLAAPPEQGLMLAAVALAALACARIRRRLLRHILPGHAESWSVALATLLATGLIAPLLFWLNWAGLAHPAQLQDATLAETFGMLSEDLRSRHGRPSDPLGPFVMLDAMKLWLAIRPEFRGWGAVIYCLDAAGGAFFVARTGALLAAGLRRLPLPFVED
ncbi:hypothetical protein [Salipiger sp.]|uniref:hypothetical protein n=1 Tax=Salipiger sp. TaxID=2078585 RepID=UPI003A9851ED